GTASVGVRQSPHPLATELVRAFGAPLTATSANRSGEEAAVTGEEVRRLFGAEVDLVLDGGATPGRAGSTLVAVTRQGIHRIREGCIAFREIERLVSAPPLVNTR
ncbi:MAG: threonylcarbamoyl-AMP synthase, partial [Deltaproteobacteria bacterium]|nr:threonylcarbamoyl-AMP synthase [Deltaproteobacteria bacterium]